MLWLWLWRRAGYERVLVHWFSLIGRRSQYLTLELALLMHSLNIVYRPTCLCRLEINLEYNLIIVYYNLEIQTK